MLLVYVLLLCYLPLVITILITFCYVLLLFCHSLLLFFHILNILHISVLALYLVFLFLLLTSLFCILVILYVLHVLLFSLLFSFCVPLRFVSVHLASNLFAFLVLLVTPFANQLLFSVHLNLNNSIPNVLLSKGLVIYIYYSCFSILISNSHFLFL